MDHNYLDSIFQQIVINFYLWAMATKSANNNKPDFGSYTMTVARPQAKIEGGLSVHVFTNVIISKDQII